MTYLGFKLLTCFDMQNIEPLLNIYIYVYMTYTYSTQYEPPSPICETIFVVWLGPD